MPGNRKWKMCPGCQSIYDEGQMALCDVDPHDETDISEFCNGCDDCWELNATKAEKEEHMKKRMKYADGLKEIKERMNFHDTLSPPNWKGVIVWLKAGVTPNQPNQQRAQVQAFGHGHFIVTMMGSPDRTHMVHILDLVGIEIADGYAIMFQTPGYRRDSHS